MSDVVDELLSEVRKARNADSARKRHSDRVKELLVQVRQERPDLTIPQIEQMIGRYYDRATISRITAAALGTSRKPAES